HELVIGFEAADGHVEREPVRRIGERVELDPVAASGEPVEVLEDHAVPAADAGVFGDVHDPQAAVLVAHAALFEERAPTLPEEALGLALALADLPAARDRLVMDEARR